MSSVLDVLEALPVDVVSRVLSFAHPMVRLAVGVRSRHLRAAVRLPATWTSPLYEQYARHVISFLVRSGTCPSAVTIILVDTAVPWRIQEMLAQWRGEFPLTFKPISENMYSIATTDTDAMQLAHEKIRIYDAYVQVFSEASVDRLLNDTAFITSYVNPDIESVELSSWSSDENDISDFDDIEEWLGSDSDGV